MELKKANVEIQSSGGEKRLPDVFHLEKGRKKKMKKMIFTQGMVA